MRISALVLALALAGPVHGGEMETAALALVNKARAKAGCAALVVNPALQAAAKGHAAAMAKQNFFSHTGKNGSTMGARIKAEGYRGRKLAENIAAGQDSAAEVVQSWLDSAGHRRNMLECDFGETGLALAYQPDDKPLKGQSFSLKYYWVQTFGQH